MKSVGSKPYSQWLSNNTYLKPNQFLVLIPISLRYILILSSHLRLFLHEVLFPLGLLVNILKALLPFSIRATWSTHLSLLDLITMTVLGERYKLWRLSLCSLLPSLFAPLLDPNIRLRILFSNTHNLHASLNVRDHVSQPYRTTGNIIVHIN